MEEDTRWRDLLKGIEFDLPDTGDKAPDIEAEKQPKSKEAEVLANKKVFVQKIITEVWVYTDIENKNYGQTSIQDITVLGEMDYEDAIKLINIRKNRRKKNP